MQLYSKQNPFRTLSEWVVLYVLLLGPPCSGSYPTYSRRDRRTNEVFVCKQCPPGTYVAEECTNDKDTVCQLCPALHYTQYWNYLKKCLYCNVFCNSLEEEVRPCNGTHNRACQCKAGYHSDLDFCIKHSSCPLGTGVAQLGNPQEDTTCIPCPQGTFSDSVSSTEVCQPHRDCSKQGLAVSVPGNQFHDTFCTACKMSKANSTKDKADELLGIGSDCQDAIIDFVPYQVGSQRRLERLLHRINGSAPAAGCDEKSPLVLQVELHGFLIQLKDTLGKQVVVQKLWKALDHMKLQNIQKKIQKHFLSS
ncbi:tumor necrosis factor receptor superfamily member 6B [Podarcis raffonei]|uniref:tumor necrosis factor receptor superfamily member 6B n=1 Tax=Podarcis raffonei TaxID=65483 RepID=UPI0023294206|nr:tumor necrosis factor receptor superfamily member 6B [Podarcis raffonei]XP_053250575.1 tumor necrosis factor receptor superfamily member 6B [Podarcis raffonei]XP_053250576.1 tumor necrosis factor receptor superfamily member 6B [Podarcis raffonei]